MRRALPIEDLDQILAQTRSLHARLVGARVLVTGGTGFIGAWIVEALQHCNRLLDMKLELLVLTRDAARAKQLAPHAFDRSDTVLWEGDVRTFGRLQGAIDFCIHAATDVSEPDKAGDPLKTFETIVDGTRRTMEYAAGSGATRVLLLSSGAVYGIQPTSVERLGESYVGAPDPVLVGSAYGNGKRAAEAWAFAYADHAAESKLAVTVARIFAVLGPGLPLSGGFAAGNFIRDAIAGREICVRDGRPLRSYLYVADVCIWLLHILLDGETKRAYNVGSERALSIEQLADRIAIAAGMARTVRSSASGLADASSSPRYVPDTSRARQELRLAEYTSLDTALSKTIEWSRLATLS